MKLTNAAIRAAVAASNAYRLHDGLGLYLEVSRSGGKWWRFKYRFQRRENRLSLGTWPAVSLREARAKRDELRYLLARGVDPAEQRRAARASAEDNPADSFETVAREWYARNAPSWSESHGPRILRRLERDVFPWLGRSPVSDLTAHQFLKVIRRIEKRGALETAHRALSNCGQVMRYAVATGRAERDPTSDLRGALTPVKKSHFAAVTEPGKVAGLLRALDGYRGTLTVRCALRIAPLVFVRPGELRHARWEDIDLEAGEWRFTSSKTRLPHIVPLARQAVVILHELRPATGGGKYVFPGLRSRNGNRPMSDNAVLVAMRSLGIGPDVMTGHGFRAMARTILDEVLGFRPDYIEHQLAHAVRDPQGRAYNRTKHLPERRKMMQAWADYLDKLRSESSVTPLKRA